MTVAELVTRMLDAGASPEVIGLAVQAMVEQPSAGAQRTRRWRHKASQASQVTVGDVSDAPLDKSGFPPNPLPVKTQPPKESPLTGGQRKSPDEVSEAFGLWNETARRLSLPTASKLTSDRRTRLKARLDEHGLDGWRAALDQLEHSPHCLGQNNRKWRADLEFLLSPQKFARLLDGGYRGTGPPESGPLGSMLREIAQRQAQEPDYDLDLKAIAH